MPLTKQQELAVMAGGQNIIVSAGAGSGKTKVLTERVFKHLEKDGWDIDSLLIMTFTNAAAAEMKSRIRKAIASSSLNEDNKKKQLSKIDSSFIMTFDAYALYLVKKYCYELGIDPKIAVIDSSLAEIKTDELIDELFEELYGNKDEDFIKLVDTYCVKDDSLIRDAVKMVNAKLNIIYDRKGFIDSYTANYLSEEFFSKVLAQYTAVILEKIKKIKASINELSSEIDIGKVYSGIDKLLGADNYNDIKEHCVITYGRLPSGLDENVKKLNDKTKKLINSLSDDTELSVEELQTQATGNGLFISTIFALCDVFNERFMAYKKKLGLYEFSDIFRMAIDLVNGHEEIRKEIKNSFKEILVDEYQDTSDLQDEFIKRIANNNVYMVGDIKQSIYRFRNAAPELFKEKYEAYKKGEGGMAIDLTSNFRSRREVLEDINLIFEDMMELDIGGADYKSGHQMNAGNTNFEKGGKVKENCHLDLFEVNDEEIKKFSKAEVEAFIIAKDIKKKLSTGYQVSDFGKVLDSNGNVVDGMITRPCEYKDFAILIDRATDFDLYRQIFTYFELPVNIRREEKLYDSDLMKVVRRIFRLIVCIYEGDFGNEFKHSYVSVARSFLVNMSDNEITELFAGNTSSSSSPDSSLINGIQTSEPYLSAKGIASGLESKTIKQVLDEIIDSFEVYQKLLTIQDVKANMVKIDYFYKLAKSLGDSGFTVKDFTEYLFNADPEKVSFNMQDEASNSIEITTIHKSKGLEYPIVYLPGLTKQFNRMDNNDRIMFSKKFGLVLPEYIPERGIRNTFVKQLCIADTNREDVSEKIRLFYVALTRAREKLILVSGLDKDTAFKSDSLTFRQLLNGVYPKLIEAGYVHSVDTEDLGLTTAYRTGKGDFIAKIKEVDKDITIKETKVYEPQIAERSHFSKSPALISKEEAKLMKLGTKIHQALEVTDLKDPKLDKYDEKIRNIITRFLSSELVLDIGNAKIYKEYEFIGKEIDGEGKTIRKHGIIDLLLEYEDRFVIIDYKLSDINDSHYDEQLRGYQTYVSSLSDKPVYCYLYSLLTGTYREVK